MFARKLVAWTGAGERRLRKVDGRAIWIFAAALTLTPKQAHFPPLTMLIVGAVEAEIRALVRSKLSTYQTVADKRQPSGSTRAIQMNFDQPYIDLDVWRELPVRHRYVHGGFANTDTRFSFYFPGPEQYEGRFFQHITPVPISENLAQTRTGEDDKIGFSLASGGYFVESNGGGMSAMPPAQPASVTAYEANAAVAQYSRVIANRIYGAHRPYGYAYGGSGGAFRTIGGFENTTGIWDGVVPYVVGSPMAIPSVFTVRMLALRILADKFPSIMDALEPGGSGNMYHGLNDEERAVLSEVTRMGFPPKGWFNHRSLGMGGLAVLFDAVAAMDPGYFRDFWAVPGYAGSNPSDSLQRARCQHRTTIRQIVTLAEATQMGWDVAPAAAFAAPRGGVDTAWKELQSAPVGFLVEVAPPADALDGAKLRVLSGSAAGQVLPLRKVEGDRIVIGSAVVMGGTSMAATPQSAEDLLAAGNAVEFDNSDFLAMQYFHRHQVPTLDFSVWDQFRAGDGSPLYPQRPMLVGPIFAAMTGGALQSGRFDGKMILVASLMDQDAFPWQADWYRAKVESHLGPPVNDHFRLWFTENALHGDQELQEDETRTVSYLSVLNQALRDLSAWVERGIPPPASTDYRVVDGQVQIPAVATARKGIQPVVTLMVNGEVSKVGKVGEELVFEGMITVPPQAGTVSYAEFNFDGSATFSDKVALDVLDDVGVGAAAKVRMPHVYYTPGTYFPTLRVACNRAGDRSDPHTQIKNIARMRVVIQ